MAQSVRGEAAVARGDDGAGVAPHRKLARDAGAADGGDRQVEALAPLHLAGDMIGKRRQASRFRMHALGDHHHWHGLCQRLAEPVDGPADAGGAYAQHDQIGIGAKRRWRTSSW